MELGGGRVEGICRTSVNKIWRRNGAHRELITEKNCCLIGKFIIVLIFYWDSSPWEDDVQAKMWRCEINFVNIGEEHSRQRKQGKDMKVFQVKLCLQHSDIQRRIPRLVRSKGERERRRWGQKQDGVVRLWRGCKGADHRRPWSFL